MFQQLNRVVDNAFFSLLCSLCIFHFHNNHCGPLVFEMEKFNKKIYIKNIPKRESMDMKIELFNQNGKRSLHSLILEANLCVVSSMLQAIITKPST